jgi:predicted kinase
MSLSIMPTVLKPVLSLVSGQPASGKSTLAKQLGRALGMSCVCRDELTAHSGRPTDLTRGHPDAGR